MEQATMPRPEEITKMTQSNALAAIVPQIMNAIGGGDKRTQSLLMQQQQQNNIQMEKQKEQMFMRSIMSPDTGEINPELIQQNAALYGVDPSKAMQLFMQFSAFKKQKAEAQKQKDIYDLGLKVATTNGVTRDNISNVLSSYNNDFAGMGLDPEVIMKGTELAKGLMPEVEKPKYGWVSDSKGNKTWNELTPGTVSMPEPDLTKSYNPNGTSTFVKKELGATVQEKPEKGMRIEVGPDGTVVQTNVGDTGIAKTTKSKVEENLITANETYSDLKNIVNTYDAKFLKGKEKLKFLTTAFKDKWDIGTVTKEDKNKLQEYTDFKRGSVSALNNYIKKLTGAQMSEQEAERLTKGVPNPGLGLIDGDSPVEFKAKLDSVMKELDRVIARNNYILKAGLKSYSEVPLDKMDSIIDARAEEIENSLKQKFPNKKQSEIEEMTAKLTAEEFGLRFQ